MEELEGRILCHFSCGAASAVATWLALKEQPERVKIVNIYVKDEHEDNERFLRDRERWYGVEIERLQREEYGASVDAVIEKHRYLRGPHGARCTIELKKAVRQMIELPTDTHVFGYTYDEQRRAERAVEANFGMTFWFPLIEAGLTHQDCLAIVNDIGIKLPVMYELGFNNNNCIGCLKAEGPAYWLRVKRNFPDVFWKRAAQERELGYALCRVKKQPVFLDELADDVDVSEPDLDLSCSLLCQIAVSE